MTKVQLLTKKSKILLKTVSICTIDPNEISERFASNADKACERFDPTNFLLFLCYFGSTTDTTSLFLNCKSSIRFDELLSNERIFTCEARNTAKRDFQKLSFIIWDNFEIPRVLW